MPDSIACCHCIPCAITVSNEYSFRYIRTCYGKDQIAALRQRGNSGGIPLAGHGLYRRPHRPERSPNTQSGCDLLCPHSGLLYGRRRTRTGRRHPLRHEPCPAYRGPRTLRGLRRARAEIHPQKGARAMASRRRNGRHASSCSLTSHRTTELSTMFNSLR